MLSLNIFKIRISTISLHFINNSAGVTGSSLYGGQLNKCRMQYYIGSGDVKASDALGTFINMSIILLPQHINEPGNISSQAEKIKFCQSEKILDYRNTLSMRVHPGEQFNITVIALGQAGSPVPAIVYSQNNYTGDDYRLSPSNQQINGSCTNITFQLFSINGDGQKQFKLYPENPCQSLNSGLSLSINISSCPVGFELIDHRCECSSKLQTFTHKCSIDNSIEKIERMRNNFWISSMNTDMLIIHGFRYPLDYCKDASVSVSLSDPSVQCDHNRNRILCGKCQKNFSLALGSLHCLPCDNTHSALILIFAIVGVALVAVVFFASPNSVYWNT